MRSNTRCRVAPSGLSFLNISRSAFSQSRTRGGGLPPKRNPIYLSAFIEKTEFAVVILSLKGVAPDWAFRSHNGLPICMADASRWRVHPKRGVPFLFAFRLPPLV